MAKGSMKKVPGKSTPKAETVAPYKPSLWLDGKQVPKELKGAKYGDTVNMTVKAKVTRVSEGAEGKSVSVELQKMAVAPKK